MTIGSVTAVLGIRAVGRAFSPHFWNFSPIPAGKPLAKRCRVPPNTETDSQPREPRPPCAKVRGQVRVNVLCPTPVSPPSTPLPVLCRRGGRCRQPLPRAAAQSRSRSSTCRCLRRAQPAFPTRLHRSHWACTARVLSEPFCRVPARGCDSGVLLLLSVPLSAPPRSVFSRFTLQTL